MKKLYIIGILLLLLAIQGCNICEKFHSKKKVSEPIQPIVVYDSAQIQSLNDTIDVLQNKIAELENKSAENKGLLSVSNRDFYESVVKSYDSIQSGYYKQLVDLLSAIQEYNNNDAVEPSDGYIEIEMDTVQILRDSIAGLQNRIAELENISEAVKAVQDINDIAFFKSIIKAPLSEKYDSVQVGYYEQLVELFDYKDTIYYPLLKNYGTWNDEIAGYIKKVVKILELRGTKVTPEYEKERFNKNLESCGYYKYRKAYRRDQAIEYLDNVIKETKSLFEDPSKFKQENFEEQLRKLK